MFNAANFPGASDHAADRGAERSTRCSPAASRDRRRRAAQRGHRPVRVHGHGTSARACARRASSSRTPGASGRTSRSTRACATSCSSRSRRSTTATRRRRSTTSAALGRRTRDTVCNLFQPGNQPGKRPQFINFGEGHAGLQHRLQQLGAERRRGVDARAAATGSRARMFGRNEGDSVASRRLHAGVQPRGHGTTSPTSSTPTRASRFDATRNQGLGNLGGGSRCCSANGRTSAPAPFPPTPAYPADRRRDRGRQPVRSEPPGAVRRLLDRRPPAHGRPQHGGRSPLRRHAVARPVGDAELQRDQHLRERVPQRVPRGAGQPAGQHRRRARRHRASPIAGPARARCRCRSCSRTSRAPAIRTTPRCVHVDELQDEQRRS